MPDRFPFDLTDQCVRCGLCLPHCPTYQLEQSEAEGPRGRIVVMEALAKAQIPATPAAHAHLNHCLGCARCEQVCPAKVPYLHIRDKHRSRYLGRPRKALLWALSRGLSPLAQRFLAWAQIAAKAIPALALPRRLHSARALLLTRTRPLKRSQALHLGKAHSPDCAQNPPAEFFRGCLASGLDPRAQDAAAELLADLDSPVYPSRQPRCCGALAQHAGAVALAEQQRTRMAQQNVPLVALDSGCIADLRRSGRSVSEACRYLLQHWPAHWQPRTLDMRVAVHLPCTHRNNCGDSSAVRELLERIPGLEIVELRGLGCCGAGGTHVLDHPERAAEFARRLLEEIPVDIHTLVSTNMGCRSHLRSQPPALQIQHPLELLRISLPTFDR